MCFDSDVLIDLEGWTQRIQPRESTLFSSTINKRNRNLNSTEHKWLNLDFVLDVSTDVKGCLCMFQRQLTLTKEIKV